ncbi:RNA polymerase sigma factor [Granulicella paludicola]|uniref:RNA polymerase sigma factor n=1 Tax=Granulicella paludicola TaxID=474951 RepID=UPI0021DFF1D2|nr:sigma-70 family RNA polymerase sigma factor [Granulicella paludicola]
MSSRLLELVLNTSPSGAEDRAQSVFSRTGLLQLLPLSLRPDEELARALRQGDGDALAVLFERHHKLVYRIARRIVRNDAEAEDTVQQIFLDVFRSIDQFNPEKASFKTWLLMFAYHRALNCRRSLMARHFFATDPFEESLLGTSPLHHANLQHRIYLQQALRELKPHQRRTIELTYFEGLTAEEIASRTGESVRVVRHNLYRGLDKMRHFLCASTPRHSAKGEAK